MSKLSAIPIPLRQRWLDFRTRALPLLILGSALVLLAVCWRNYAVWPSLVGQVEPTQANVSCFKPGMLAQLGVTRFQRDKAGDTIGQVVAWLADLGFRPPQVCQTLFQPLPDIIHPEPVGDGYGEGGFVVIAVQKSPLHQATGDLLSLTRRTP